MFHFVRLSFDSNYLLSRQIKRILPAAILLSPNIFGNEYPPMQWDPPFSDAYTGVIAIKWPATSYRRFYTFTLFNDRVMALMETVM